MGALTTTARSLRSTSFQDAHRRIDQTLATIKRESAERAARYAPKTTTAAKAAVALGAGIEGLETWQRRVKSAWALIDEDTRTGAALDLGKDLVDEYLIERHLPWVRGHPYVAMHRAHLRILEGVIRTLDAHERADRRLREIVQVCDRLRQQISAARTAFGDARTGQRMSALREQHLKLRVGQAFMRMILESSTRDQLQQYVRLHGNDLLAFWLQVRSYEADIDRQAQELLGLLCMARLEVVTIQRLERRFEAEVSALSKQSTPGSILASGDLSMQALREAFERKGPEAAAADVENLRSFAENWAGEIDAMRASLHVGSLLLAMIRKMQGS